MITVDLDVPVSVCDGKERESVTPRVSEVVDGDPGVAGHHATTPD